MATLPSQRLRLQLRSLIPPLSPHAHKGQAGRVGVVGGSHDYTGAPYFAAMSAMRLGADLAHNICEPGAGNVIKTYSPDLIVHRYLAEDSPLDEIRKRIRGVFDRLHSVVVGPGLGRDDHMQGCAKIAIELAREMDIYLLVDADGLWLLQKEPDILNGYAKAILTPNVVEFSRLCKTFKIEEGESPRETTRALAAALCGPVVVRKGQEDIISDGKEVLICDASGGLKRCGGQGDILSGCGGTFLAWASIYAARSEADKMAPERTMLLAGYGASLVARTCSRKAFQRLGRSMLADDLLPEVGSAYEELFTEETAGK